MVSLHLLLKKLYVAQSGVLQTLDGLQKVLIIRHDGLYMHSTTACKFGFTHGNVCICLSNVVANIHLSSSLWYWVCWEDCSHAGTCILSSDWLTDCMSWEKWHTATWEHRVCSINYRNIRLNHIRMAYAHISIHNI